MKGSIQQINIDLGQLNTSISRSFSQMPEQVRERSLKEGFVFNLLVIGRRGNGTSTLINSLFSTTLVNKDRSDGITTTTNEIIEGNVKLTISITTYHGDDYSRITKYIEDLNEEYFENEQGLNVPFMDKRIHCCLYLVPTDKINDKEIETLQELCRKVNLIPIITKADMFTSEELRLQREKINKIFIDNQIQFYDYGETSSTLFPMAVIASEQIVEDNGIRIRGRKYPWCVIDTENSKYSDFKKLQKILIGERFIDLIFETDRVFYCESRRRLMEENTPAKIKQRLVGIMDQLNETVDRKYSAIIEELKAEQTRRLAMKTNEMTIEKHSTIVANE